MERNIINKVKRELNKIRANPLDSSSKPQLIERDGQLLVSAEDSSGLVDYYGEFRGGYPYIDPRIEYAATKYGCYWEWEHAGAICLAD